MSEAEWREQALEMIRQLRADNARLRAVVEAADKYDRCKIGYPAFRIALNKWRKSERVAAEAGEGEEGEK